MITSDSFLQDDPFGAIRPQDFPSLGIDPEEITAGTFAARKHPSKLMSRFGGNAYGFGFFEIYDRLSPKDLQFIQSLSLQNPEQTSRSYKEINRVYRNLGLLTRFSRFGRPYYLIPLHLVSNSVSAIRTKVEEIGKIVDFHRRKYLKESHRIGVVTHADDPIPNELALRFREHRFVTLDSWEGLRSQEDTLDLVILSRDIYELLFETRFNPSPGKAVSRKELEGYALHTLGKIHRLLKPGGEIFIVAHRHPSEKSRILEVLFRTEQEKKNFLLFTHIFKTRSRYVPHGDSVFVDSVDFQRYLNPPYVEAEVIDRLLGERGVADLRVDEIQSLPYLGFPLHDRFSYDQEKTWAKLSAPYFNQIFLKPMVPELVKQEWGKRFSTDGYLPDYMLLYLGQKRPPQVTLDELKRDVAGSRLAGCPLPLLAHDRDSFDYVLRTLEALKRIRNRGYPGLPNILMDRLAEPLESKRNKTGAQADTLRLMSRKGRLQRIQSFLNPGGIEGKSVRMLDHLETLSLFGFTPGELREIFLIVVGHTAMERVLWGKMSEKALKPVTDRARSMDSQQMLHFLRYCRLMSMAETAASKRHPVEAEEVLELFDIYGRMLRVATNRDLDWARLLEERTGALGGIRSQAVRKVLKMMGHFRFLSNWAELGAKGEMEKESLAGYDDARLREIERVIRLVQVIHAFEKMHFKGDPLRASVFYRHLLNLEFHGTAGIFGRLESDQVFPLLWITVNVTRGDVVNFNPVFSDVKPSTMEDRLARILEGVGAINARYLDPRTLEQFTAHLYEDESGFILGTGFQLKVNRETGGMDVHFIDMEENLHALEKMTAGLRGKGPSQLPEPDLRELERLFSNVEGFYQSHLRLLSHEDQGLRVPERERDWFRRAGTLRGILRTGFIATLFRPRSVHTELALLVRHAPSLLEFLLPEVMDVERAAPREGEKRSVIASVLARTKKLQALVECDRTTFQDSKLLHKAAQREFGPMASGIVGLNDSHIRTLEGIVQTLRGNGPLFDALVKSFVLSAIGLHPGLRSKYRDRVHPADLGNAGSLILENEPLAGHYGMGEESYRYLILLIRNQDLLYHMIRGEFSFYAMEDVVLVRDQSVFDAIFLSSFITFYASGEDMILEELATRLFQFRVLCHRILSGEAKADAHLAEVYEAKGHLFKALESYDRKSALPDAPSQGTLDAFEWLESERGNYLEAGKMIYALERIFRLRGVRYVEFADLAHFMARVPLRYIYRKRRHFGIGYGTFERELFEARRIYNALQGWHEKARHYILQRLVTDEVRLFGFETVSAHLNYDNQVKVLWLALLGTEKMRKGSGPVCLDFSRLERVIEKRFEAVNAFLCNLFPEGAHAGAVDVTVLFGAETGIVFRMRDEPMVVSVDFIDPVDISRKCSYMKTITDEAQLKNFFHHALRMLRDHPFHTDDYERELEKAYDQRLEEITDQMLDQLKRRIEQLREFSEIRDLVMDMTGRSLDIGFTEEQKHRLNDLFELRIDELKREKLEEVDLALQEITGAHELRDYWDSIKWYLSGNREFLGKEFELLVARKFDEAMKSGPGRNARRPSRG